MPVISEHSTTTSMTYFYTFDIVYIESSRVRYFFRYGIFCPVCPVGTVIDIIDCDHASRAFELYFEIDVVISSSLEIVSSSSDRRDDASIGWSSWWSRVSDISRETKHPIPPCSRACWIVAGSDNRIYKTEHRLALAWGYYIREYGTLIPAIYFDRCCHGDFIYIPVICNGDTIRMYYYGRSSYFNRCDIFDFYGTIERNCDSTDRVIGPRLSIIYI